MAIFLNLKIDEDNDELYKDKHQELSISNRIKNL